VILYDAVFEQIAKHMNGALSAAGEGAALLKRRVFSDPTATHVGSGTVPLFGALSMPPSRCHSPTSVSKFT
jgi:hypothetical protein